MSSIKMKLFSGQVVLSLLGEDIDWEKVKKYTTDAKYDSGDVKAAIAVLSYILSSAAKYSCSSSDLSRELQQLGLPKEHTVALCKLYADKMSDMQDYFKLKSLKWSQVVDVEWKVVHLLEQVSLEVIEEPMITMMLSLQDPATKNPERISFTMTSRKFHVFLHEMKQAREVMSQVTNSL